jgi:hypothetical protein
MPQAGGPRQHPPRKHLAVGIILAIQHAILLGFTGLALDD